MSAAAKPLPAEPEREEPLGDVLIARQPVVDGARRVTGYRIAYAMPEREGTEIRLFGDVLSAVGLEELVGESLAHLPVSSELLLNLGIPPVRPDRVVLQLGYGDALDPELRPILDTLAGRGYALALCDLPDPDFEVSLLDLFGTVEVDFSTWKARDAAAAAERILAACATPLAVGVADDKAFEQAKKADYHLFSGPFYAAPRSTSVRSVPVGGVRTLVSLAQLQGEAASIEELVQVVDRDVGLSVKLLRYINSAYFGMRSSISSVRHAVMMLGSRGVSRWALMVALTGAPSAPRELSVMALTRARMCEILGAGRTDVEPDQLFTIGLLSAADALLDQPLEAIVAELPLADEVAGALLHRSGAAGAILEAAISYERGGFDVESMQAHRQYAGHAYRDALGWARATVHQLS